MKDRDIVGISRRKLLTFAGMAGAAALYGTMAGAAGGSVAQVTESVYGDGDCGTDCCVPVAVIDDMSSLHGCIGSESKQHLLVRGYHPGTTVGGGRLFWNTALPRTMHDGGIYFSPTAPWTANTSDYSAGAGETEPLNYGVWQREIRTACSLYDWGGQFESDCRAAMNAALASDVETIVVPDRVTLGQHVFDCERKVIIGGREVEFAGANAGFRPRNCDYIEFKDFSALRMSMNVEDRHIFVGPAGGAAIGKFVVRNCSGSGGIIGVAASFENGRSIGRCEITHNDFSDLQGEVGGQGYGIQYANENLDGTALIAHNKVTRAGRHSFYIARNPGGLVELIGNIAVDHREHATATRNNYRPAFCIARSSHVIGFGNVVDGYYDGAWLIDWENEPVANPLFCRGIAIYASTIKNPRNFLNGISFGYLSPSAEALRDIAFIGVDYVCTGVPAPLFAFNYGHNLLISQISARFDQMTGVVRMGMLTGRTEADSSHHVVEHVRVRVTNSPAAIFAVFRIQLGSNTQQIRTCIRQVDYVSDAAVNKTFDAQLPVNNRRIELMGCEADGLAEGVPSRASFPSMPWNGLIVEAAATTPVGTAVPHYFGHECYLTHNGTFWKANGTTSADWVKLG